MSGVGQYERQGRWETSKIPDLDLLGVRAPGDFKTPLGSSSGQDGRCESGPVGDEGEVELTNQNGLLSEILELRGIAERAYGSAEAADHTEGIFQAIGELE